MALPAARLPRPRRNPRALRRLTTAEEAARREEREWRRLAADVEANCVGCGDPITGEALFCGPCAGNRGGLG